MGWRERFSEPVAGRSSRRGGLDVARAALARITTPLLPDDYLQLANPLWSARELRGRIVRVIPETADDATAATAATLVIEPGWGFGFDYRPGQYVGIGVLVEGRWTWRSYSLTSIPDATPADTDGSGLRGRRRSGPQHISVTVQAMPEGFLSSHLVNGLQPGTIVRLAAPQGDFVLPEPPPPAVLFVTAGSGITPVISMLRTMRHRGQHSSVQLIHSVSDQDDLLFADELAAMHDEGLLDLHVQTTGTDGRLDRELLTRLCPDWAERETWACGPSGFLEMVGAVFGDAGVSERLHVERFTLERGDVDAQGGTVTFGRGGRVATVDGATTLLEAGESVGVQMPFGCRMGICQSCVVMLDRGCVRDLRSGTEHVEGERIQTCISVAAGDCTLDV
ncbi:ferredoxin reductase [Williamsia sterculiae]|uniref:Ferredoxin-NADP reductase n=1 Tax=Williamsia sterculiae TaxID=1344003 RepID=A0A1N7GT94_9NOCA|nr:ferredoxin reductase [Williamsia sterculiae]SIS15774.1 Ferredoxin-NADP reductase [Williamsia sterculiae]